MLLLQVLDDIGQVVTSGRQTFLRTGFGDSPGAVGTQIGKVPPGDETPQSGDSRMLCELPQRIDRDRFGRAQALNDTFTLLIRHLTGHDTPRPFSKIEKPERSSERLSIPVKPLLGHEGTFGVLVDR